MDIDQIARVIDLCRAKGVSALEVDGLKLVLGSPPAAVMAHVDVPRAETKPKTPVQEIEALEARILRGSRLPNDLTRSRVT